MVLSKYKNEKDTAELYLPTRHPALRGLQQGFNLTCALARVRVRKGIPNVTPLRDAGTAQTWQERAFSPFHRRILIAIET